MAQRAYQAVMADDSIADDERAKQAKQAALLTYFTLQRNARQFLRGETDQVVLESPEFRRAQNFIQLLPVADRVKEAVMDRKTKAVPLIMGKAIIRSTTFPREM